MQRKITILSVLLAVALGLTSCGSDDASSSDSPAANSATAEGGSSGDQAATAKLDLCTLLTEEQVTAAMGKPVEAGKLSDPAGFDVCGWSADSVQGVDGTDLTAMTQTIFDGSLKGASELAAMGMTIEPVEGLGDAAYYSLEAEGTPTLAFTKNGAYLYLSVDNETFTQQQAKDAELQLARQVLANL